LFTLVRILHLPFSLTLTLAYVRFADITLRLLRWGYLFFTDSWQLWKKRKEGSKTPYRHRRNHLGDRLHL